MARYHNGNDGIMVSLAYFGLTIAHTAVKMAPHALKLMNGEISTGQFVVNVFTGGTPAAFKKPDAQPVLINRLTQKNLHLIYDHLKPRSLPLFDLKTDASSPFQLFPVGCKTFELPFVNSINF